jgi:uncharacterized cupredoxin-like copper-binding protein
MAVIWTISEVRPLRRGQMKHLVLLVLLITGLVGCTSGDVILDEPQAAYVQDVPTVLAGVNWSEAQSVTAQLSEYQFEPSDLVFEEGTPYRLVLSNIGKRSHTFVSEGFFQAIAVQKLISPDGEIATPYLKTIEVPSQTEKELHFVAVRKGTYSLECSVLLHETFGMEGQISIQ